MVKSIILDFLKKDRNRKNFSNWKTESDTEILIEGISLFGLSDFLDLVEGMFAFVIYDTIEKIFLVRDRFEKSPSITIVIQKILFLHLI